jgi:aspartyl-tRNA(Asn)/glutamyl-tRNA(Gln) amidotransferase subunit C
MPIKQEVNMKFGKSTVEYVAKLARIKLTGEEIERLSSQLGDILKYVEKLNKVDTSSVEPTSHVLSLKNVYRKDKIKKSLDVKDALKNTPSKEGDFFKVPRIIE